MSDLCDLVVRLLRHGAPSGRVLEVAGPEEVSLADILRGYRAWLGFRPAPVISVPRWAAWPMLKAGDMAAQLGWASSFRTTAVRQMDHNVGGDPDTWVRLTGVQPRGFSEVLAAEPASVQDRWHARLYFFRPLAVLTLGLFWLLVGLLGLISPARTGAIALLREAGFGALSAPVSDVGHLADLVLGSALFVRRWTRSAAVLMVLFCVGYLIGATVWLPRFWIDPLAPWLKVFPVVALALFVAATDDRR